MNVGFGLAWKWPGAGMGLIALILAWSCDFKRTERPGGNWEVMSRHSWLPEAGFGESRLFRRTPRGQIEVARWVGAFQYLGNDCLLYQEHRKPVGRRYLAACGDRRPVVLIESEVDDWDIGPSGLRPHPGSVLEGKAGRPADVSAAEAMQRAMLQAPRDQL
jgi:hypothetical protein